MTYGWCRLAVLSAVLLTSLSGRVRRSVLRISRAASLPAAILLLLLLVVLLLLTALVLLV